jgi:3-hydroxybutyryl-CoA dehydrogenase
VTEIKKVSIVRCGLMGSGIAEVCARSGRAVIIPDLSDEILEKGIDRIEQSLSKAVSRGKISQHEKPSAPTRIKGTTQLADLANCALVIEAVPENLEEKKKALAELDKILSPHAIIATNSSSRCVTEMASVTKRGDKVLGTHFFYPVRITPLLELVRTALASVEAMATIKEFAASLGRPTIVAKDRPGYVSTRLVIPFLLDAVRVYEEGLASGQDIDTALERGMNHPMGPLKLIDFFGLDTLLFIADGLHEEFKDERFAAPALPRRMATAGHLGRKTGKGSYEY